MLYRNLSLRAKVIYFVVESTIADSETGLFDNSIDELCQVTGHGRSSVRHALDDLVSYGVLEETVRPGHTTLYKIIEKVDMMTPEEQKEFDDFQELCSKMTPEELDAYAENTGDEIIIIKFPQDQK